MTDPGGVIDGHVHWGRWTRDRVGWPGSDLAAIRDAMRRCGVSGAALMPTDEKDNAGLARAIAADPAGLFLFAWLDPHAPDRTLAFLEEHAERIAGLKIHPSLERLRVDDPGWRPFLELAERRRLPVIVHTGLWKEMANWRYGVTVAERHPDAAIILAHLGGSDPVLQDECSRELAALRLPNVWLGTESIREYYSLRTAIDRLGPERILFGSDFPLTWTGASLAVLDAARPTDEERRLIQGENFLRLVGRRRDA